jgi:hypothetical protein
LTNIIGEMREMNTLRLKTAGHFAPLVLAAVLFVGCGGFSTPEPTDPKKAVTALQAALEKWKSGATIESLQQEKPIVYASDEDWQAGVKLAAFELRDVIDQGGYSAHIPVRLNIQSPNGLWWKEVEYNVTVKDTAVSIMRHDVPE